MDVPVAAEIQPRKRPIQERARQRVVRILEATAELLEERGLTGLTTNHIADRAEVNIASLYQYFPNKQAVVMALADQMIYEYQQIFATFPDEFAESQDWRKTYAEYINALIEAGFRTKGAAAIRRAIDADPNFVNFDKRTSAGIGRLLAEGFRRRLGTSDMSCQTGWRSRSASRARASLMVMKQAVRSPIATGRFPMKSSICRSPIWLSISPDSF